MANEDLAVKLEDLGTAFSYKVSKTTLTDVYSNSATYAVGDYCIYYDTLYRCTTAISTAEDFTAAHWTATTIAAELNGRLKPSDVVDNLTSGGTTVPLSAEQGKALNGKINEQRISLLGSKLNVAQNDVITLSKSLSDCDELIVCVEFIDWSIILISGTIIPSHYDRLSNGWFLSSSDGSNNGSITLKKYSNNQLLVSAINISGQVWTDQINKLYLAVYGR